MHDLVPPHHPSLSPLPAPHQDKVGILEAVRGAGLRALIVGSYGASPRVDDQLGELLRLRPELAQGLDLFAFAEVGLLMRPHWWLTADALLGRCCSCIMMHSLASALPRTCHCHGRPCLQDQAHVAESVLPRTASNSCMRPLIMVP